MNAVVSVFRREFASYFATPIAFVFLIIFLFAMGVFAFYIGNFYTAGVADLQRVAQARLDRHDQELLAAARGVATFMRESPASPAEPPPADTAAMANANPNDAVAQTIVLAEAALGRTAPLAAAAPKGSL